MVERVQATPQALSLIAKLTDQYGPLMFHQSGGCCDGNSPMCFAQGDLLITDADVKLGVIGGAPFYMSRAQFEYLEHTQLTIDVAPGRGGMFSLEGSHGVRFLTRSRLYSEGEFDSLPPVESGAQA
ncbi:MAG TPA: DUF779 domain-containing protein [Aquabacterium sp.]|nr:DUF779 domain-containing protein [Aquabacterium sp.]